MTIQVGTRAGDEALASSLILAQSGPNGRFTAGLDEETYLVRAQKRGFITPPGKSAFVTTGPEPGDSVSLTLDPLVGVWIRLRDRSSGALVTVWGGVRVSTRELVGVGIMPWFPSQNPRAWSGEHPWHPGEFRRVYAVPDPALLDERAARVDLVVSKKGFRTRRCVASLRPVGEWDEGEPDTFLLDRVDGAEFGTVRLRIHNFPRAARPEYIPLSVARDGGRLTFSSRWMRGLGLYETTLVPAGTYTLLDFEAMPKVIVPPYGVAEKEVSFPGPRGPTVTFVLVDEDHRPMTHASFAMLSAGMKVVASREPRMGFREGRQTVKNVPAGRYRIVVNKAGFEQSDCTVDVVAGRNDEVTIVLARKGH